ncbi:J domain-containing protein [Fluviicola taffensis]|uniref:J domain-containing protein n=1 Tax=Fluviicola taffensis TaxID=191579 RepID=UPI0031379611
MIQLNSFLLIGGYSRRYNYSPMPPEERFWTGIIVLVLFVGVIGYVVYKSLISKDADDETDSEWDKGIIPWNFLPTTENIYEIFIASACAIVVRDLDNYYMKFPYIDSYLKKNFRDQYYYAEDSYAYSMRHVVRIDSLAGWSNRNLQKGWKVKLINFLAGVAIYDGGINNDEQRYLLALMAKLNLDITDFESIYQEKLTRKNERTYRAEAHFSRKESFYTILGLEMNASMEEVKATYRRLVKLTHPDRFMNESPEVQKQMSEKFQEIQIAYESIVNS